jgi:NADPH:quinone reductase-like Zn-dependent oxidoreductase
MVLHSNHILFSTQLLIHFFNQGKNHQGKTIFVPGGGGGVGHVIVQLAKKSGYKVITSSSRPGLLLFLFYINKI